MAFKRAVLIVLDSVGVGALPDHQAFGDPSWVNTLGNTAARAGGLKLPHLEKLGLGTLGSFEGISAKDPENGFAVKCSELTCSKDTTGGHWEIAGHVTTTPFATFTDTGFPEALMDRFIRDNGLPGVLGNIAASGTKIIAQLGDEHIASGKPIVYTSGDSVFQVACHEDHFGLDRLHEICLSARHLCDELNIARVISRPFITAEDGKSFQRTANRQDYSIDLPAKMLFEYLGDEGLKTYTVGKIASIYNHCGVSLTIKSKDNMDGVDKLLTVIEQVDRGLIAINLVDFDQEFGHRRNPAGYAKALEDFDKRLPEILKHVDQDTLLVLTADHGNDPTAPGTDHTREHVPFLAHSPKLGPTKGGSTVEGFTAIGSTIYSALTGKPFHTGQCML